MSDPFDQFHADYVARQYRSERHAALDATYPSEHFGGCDCSLGLTQCSCVQACRKPEGPSDASWLFSDLSIALIAVGVIAGLVFGVFA